jgi:hypothetical protein
MIYANHIVHEDGAITDLVHARLRALRIYLCTAALDQRPRRWWLMLRGSSLSALACCSVWMLVVKPDPRHSLFISCWRCLRRSLECGRTRTATATATIKSDEDAGISASVYH